MPIKDTNSGDVINNLNPQNDQIPSQESNQDRNSNSKPTQKKLDPQKLFDLVSKNYDTWLQVMNKQFKDEENFLPFPKEDALDKNSQPIFNYTLLEALEKASSDFSEKADGIHEDDAIEEIPATDDKEQSKIPQASNRQNRIKNAENPSSKGSQTFLKESEINFLRNKISQMIASNNFSINNTNHAPKREGFSLYDTQDEEGLHDGNTDQFYDDEQDDYDLEELQGEFLHDYPNGRHIEVELNTAPECEIHGYDGCSCPIFHDEGLDGHSYRNGAYGFDEDEEGPSCEFTFEYDHREGLVPTYSNVEEKMRLMNLESKISNNNPDIKLPSITELNNSTYNSSDKSSSKQKKKNKKKKNSNSNAANPNPHLGANPETHPTTKANASGSCCLFCEYEVIYGAKPRQMIKWYDQRVRREEQRRLEIKTKLENAKLKALKKQRELRQKQLQQSNLEQSSHPKAESNTSEIP